jgi:hypothetical protein
MLTKAFQSCRGICIIFFLFLPLLVMVMVMVMVMAEQRLLC